MNEQRDTVWLTIKEYAQSRKISETTVRRLIAAGALSIDRVSPRNIRIRLTRIVARSRHEYPPAPTS